MNLDQWSAKSRHKKTLHGCGKWQRWSADHLNPQDVPCNSRNAKPGTVFNEKCPGLSWVSVHNSLEKSQRKCWHSEHMGGVNWVNPWIPEFFSVFPRQHKLNLYGTEVEVRIRQVFFWYSAASMQKSEAMTQESRRQFSGHGFPVESSVACRWTIVVMKSL